ncbi:MULTISPECIES: dipeptidase PepV [Clostridium]|uniref:Acetylornithine deacetylase/Succinyl-diaminopimelate desuccinylase and related deacylases n=1 Tax=Clostridium botulinum B str. Osaka05 TaxID=1407017 RepID=A0A0S6U718_CLOBO|nr:MULTISPECIES: dipeptidase PepV [Clostridium]AUM97120.1 dipeptidase PepV [Clostridium sporogenes]AVQ54572.1 dipeptidase PepV [Clostridium botulinum]GAE03793.1 acetylornithine deacetylase/Succinyl-diaminopimelate desuccinylase and related deacylases [Clostridium botulinum B str. Osaka05]
MEINKIIEELKDDLIDSTAELIKIKSIEGEAKEGKPYGEGVASALEKALEISEKLGFKTVNVDGYVGYAEYGEGDEYVGVLGHLDLVPEGDGWKYPPYAAEIHDGKMYGRGTTDDKGPIMAALYGLKAIKEAKLPLSKKVRILFGTNEETGSNEIEHYLAKEKPPVLGFTPDAEYPIIYAEKGITIFDVVKKLEIKNDKAIKLKYIKGGQASNMVPDYCEAGIECPDTDMIIRSVEYCANRNGIELTAEEKGGLVVVKSFGLSAHGSTPEIGKNAIMQMFKFLAELPLGHCDELQFIRFFNNNVGNETDGKSFGVDLEDEPSGKLSFNVGTISMENNEIKMALNLRYPVTYKAEDLMEKFNKKIEGTGIKVENFQDQKPLYFDDKHPLIKSLQKVYKEQTGKEPELLAIGGGTYAKEMPNIVAFGPLFPGEPDVIHKKDEYIELENLVLNAKIYGHAIHELAK